MLIPKLLAFAGLEKELSISKETFLAYVSELIEKFGFAYIDQKTADTLIKGRVGSKCMIPWEAWEYSDDLAVYKNHYAGYCLYPSGSPLAANPGQLRGIFLKKLYAFLSGVDPLPYGEYNLCKAKVEVGDSKKEVLMGSFFSCDHGGVIYVGEGLVWEVPKSEYGAKITIDDQGVITVDISKCNQSRRDILYKALAAQGLVLCQVEASSLFKVVRQNFSRPTPEAES